MMIDQKKESKKIFLYSVLIALAGIAVIAILIISQLYPLEKKVDIEDDAADWAIDDSRSYEGIYVHDGNYETLNKLHAFVQEYFDFYQRGNIKIMYERYWDSDAMRALGYEYTESDFSLDMITAGTQNHIFNDDLDKIDFSYTAVTYEDYTNFYKYTFKLQYTYKNESSEIVHTPMAEYTYTILPYKNENGVYYKLLDFDITEIDLQSDRFNKIGEQKQTKEEIDTNYDNAGRGGI